MVSGKWREVELEREVLGGRRGLLGALGEQSDVGQGKSRDQDAGEHADSQDDHDLVDQAALVPRGASESKHAHQGT